MKAPQLDPRERMAYALALLALLLVVLLAFFIPAVPKANYARAQSRVAGLQDDLNNALLLQLDERIRVESQQALVERLKARDPAFDLFAFLNGAAGTAGIDPGRLQIDAFRTRNSNPKQPIFNMTLKGVSLKQLLDLLHTIYASGNLVALYKMDDLGPAPNGSGLDCELTFTTLKP